MPGFTLLSSVIDEGARRRIASEMARVTQLGGVVVLYDFRMNPVNPTRPLGRSDVRGRCFQAGTSTSAA